MDDVELLQKFEDCTLSFDQWTHRAHVKVAYLHLRQFTFDEALNYLRTRIKRYNAAHNVPEDLPMRGYNETTTRALLHLIAAVMQAYEKSHPVQTADEFYDMHPQVHSKHVLRFFYTVDRRMHPEAKTKFIEPDLTPLPRLQRP
jgi:outer membrane protein assembly factor BamD (BamD/ComL family)